LSLITSDHLRPLPTDVQAAATERDPDRRIIKMLGFRANNAPTAQRSLKETLG